MLPGSQDYLTINLSVRLINCRVWSQSRGGGQDKAIPLNMAILVLDLILLLSGMPRLALGRAEVKVSCLDSGTMDSCSPLLPSSLLL